MTPPKKEKDVPFKGGGFTNQEPTLDSLEEGWPSKSLVPGCPEAAAFSGWAPSPLLQEKFLHIESRESAEYHHLHAFILH